MYKFIKAPTHKKIVFVSVMLILGALVYHVAGFLGLAGFAVGFLIK